MSERIYNVLFLCTHTANEICPVWPGQPTTAHWGLPDAAAVEGSDQQKRRAFADTFRALSNRIEVFVNLPIDKLDRLNLRQKLKTIGQL